MEQSPPTVPTNWWQNFFTDVVVDMWLECVPEEMTRSEVEFIRKMLQVAPPAKILDAPCGGGRHSLPLAAAGYRMTSLDYSSDFLKAARAKAAELKLDVNWIQRNMRDIDFRQEFDGAFCFGNSFGYSDDASNAAFLKAVARSLRPGARFVLDYPVVLEALVPKFRERGWMQIGDIYFLEDERYDHVEGRHVTKYTIIRNGEVVKRHGSHRCYTYREITGLLQDAGFRDVQAFGTLSEEPFTFRSNGLYLVGKAA